MLPLISFRSVKPEDVNRISDWLEDSEISSHWFGHYKCGDPVHHGYDPEIMLNATDRDWDRVFNNSIRPIWSIDDKNGTHIGEAQIVIDAEFNAELFLMIGRKDLWHQGYGTAALIALTENIFCERKLNAAWVRIPKNNIAAIGLFNKLGFSQQDEGSPNNQGKIECCESETLWINTKSYPTISIQPNLDYKNTNMVNIAGFGYGQSMIISKLVADKIGYNVVDNYEIDCMIAKLLQCRVDEITSFRKTESSVISRLLSKFLAPTDWTMPTDILHYTYGENAYGFSNDSFGNQLISKSSYCSAINQVVKELEKAGKIVISDLNGCIFVASQQSTRVIISTPFHKRVEAVKKGSELSSEKAVKKLNQIDLESDNQYNSLFGLSLASPKSHDLSINLQDVSNIQAAELIVQYSNKRATNKIPLVTSNHG